MIQEIKAGDEIEYQDDQHTRRWARALQASHKGVVRVCSLHDTDVTFSVQVSQIIAVHRTIAGQGTVTLASMQQSVEGGMLTLRWIAGDSERVKTFSAEETASLLSLLYDHRNEIIRASRQET